MKLLRSLSLVLLFAASVTAGCERYPTTYAGVDADPASGRPAVEGTIDPHKQP